MHTDNDVSASSGKRRPGYESMLDELRSGHADAVIAWHPDRLHRQPVELETFIALCEDRGVAVQTVRSGEVDLSTPSGRAVARTIGAWARHEVEHASRADQAREDAGGDRGEVPRRAPALRLRIRRRHGARGRGGHRPRGHAAPPHRREPERADARAERPGHHDVGREPVGTTPNCAGSSPATATPDSSHTTARKSRRPSGNPSLTATRGGRCARSSPIRRAGRHGSRRHAGSAPGCSSAECAATRC